MENKKAINELNNLLEINNDRIEGYNHAFKETTEADLKSLFSKCAENSSTFRQELTAEIEKLGGTPVKGARETGKLYRAWMDIKAALARKDHKAILTSCEFGEDVTIKNYNDALKSNVLAGFHQLITRQLNILKTDHNQIKMLRESLTTAQV